MCRNYRGKEFLRENKRKEQLTVMIADEVLVALTRLAGHIFWLSARLYLLAARRNEAALHI
jgi:hypothetical protein